MDVEGAGGGGETHVGTVGTVGTVGSVGTVTQWPWTG